MDLKQNISLGKSKKIVYPTKTSINLIRTEATRKNTAASIGLFAIFLVLIAIFAKFAVVDPLASGMESSRKVEAAEQQLAAIQQENDSYQELSREYARYIVTGLTEEERNLADRNELIDLIDSTFIQATYLSSVKVVGNDLTVSCVGISLPEISALVETLEQDHRVAHVTVSTASDSTNGTSSATFEIELTGALDAAAESESDPTTEGGDNE